MHEYKPAKYIEHHVTQLQHFVHIRHF